MSLNSTPSGERTHIAFFGCRNAGKSSLLNAITNQNLAIVSDVKGTTTDPVYKAIELLPAGPVMIIDTPGLDDEGQLGEMRINSAKRVLQKTDIAVLVIDSTIGFGKHDNEILKSIKEHKIPYIVALNKIDRNKLNSDFDIEKDKSIEVSALTGDGIGALKEKIAEIANSNKSSSTILKGLINKNDNIVLVVPIDKAAPQGRIILPVQQVIRDILDHGANALICRETELKETLSSLKDKPKLVITDSQVFKQVAEIVPQDINITSFSILFARYKGQLKSQLDAIEALDNLNDGDNVLIAEGCTHHRQCGDIGTEKIPAMLSKIAKLNLDFSSGRDFCTDPKKYKLIIHCGGCMLNEQEMQSRIKLAQKRCVSITNYGMLFAKMNGVLDRSLKVFE